MHTAVARRDGSWSLSKKNIEDPAPNTAGRGALLPSRWNTPFDGTSVGKGKRKADDDLDDDVKKRLNALKACPVRMFCTAHTRALI